MTTKAEQALTAILGHDNQHNEGMAVDEGVNDPSIFKAVFLAGGPGSGKSYVTRNTTGGHGFKMVNSDDAFELFMKKAGMSLDMMGMSADDVKKKDAIRDKAKAITKKQMKGFIDGRLGIVIDGTGKDYGKIQKQMKELEGIGYTCYMIFVNTSLETAQYRNKKRARSLEADMVEKLWSRVQENMGKFQKLFRDGFLIVDNNDHSEDVMPEVWKKVGKFAKSKIKNIIAIKWIKAQLEKNKEK